MKSEPQPPPSGLGALLSVDYVIILCDDLATMRHFYADVLGFTVAEETPGEFVGFVVGGLWLSLRPRGRTYDGPAIPLESAAIQISFRVPPDNVDLAFASLKELGVNIIEGPTNQEWTHRTLFLHDPEQNIVEIYADIPSESTRSEPTGVHSLQN